MKKGEKMSDEQKKKQSITAKAWWTPERRKLVSEYMKAGRPHKDHAEYYAKLQGWK